MKGNKAFKKYYINHEVPIAIVVVGIIKAIPHFFKDQEKKIRILFKVSLGTDIKVSKLTVLLT